MENHLLHKPKRGKKRPDFFLICISIRIRKYFLNNLLNRNLADITTRRKCFLQRPNYGLGEIEDSARYGSLAGIAVGLLFALCLIAILCFTDIRDRCSSSSPAKASSACSSSRSSSHSSLVESEVMEAIKAMDENDEIIEMVAEAIVESQRASRAASVAASRSNVSTK